LLLFGNLLKLGGGCLYLLFSGNFLLFCGFGGEDIMSIFQN
jgi:hypothetical protein